MERTRRLAQFWSWLPAFRAVAEKEHLPSAADEMHLSPSALSRSVKQLEEHLGVELFERHGRGIVLSNAGRVLLEHVRGAMRLVDDGLERVTAATKSGSIRVVAPGPFASLYVLPALTRLRALHPNLVPTLGTMSGADVNPALLAGRIDLALVDDPLADPELVVEKVLDVPYGVYCGGGHPLHSVESPSREEILRHPFAAPPGGHDDHFPPDVPRTFNAHLEQLQIGVELCATGASLAVLPEPVAAQQAGLRKLPFEGIEDAALYAVYRRPLGTHSDAKMLLELIRAGLEA